MKKYLILLVFSLFVLSCENTIYGTSTYKYEVTGNVSAVSVTMSDENGNTVQHNNVALPWYYSFTKDNVYSYFAYVSAHNNDSTGNITVTIYRNGKAEKSATSTGAYCIATAFYSYD